MIGEYRIIVRGRIPNDLRKRIAAVHAAALLQGCIYGDGDRKAASRGDLTHCHHYKRPEENGETTKQYRS